MRRYASAAASALLGAGLAAVAFVATGGFELSSVTWTEIAIVLLSGALIAAGILRAPRGGRLNGGITLAAFVGLAALVALSILWSIAPDDSWLEANLTIAYVFAFGGAVALARIVPDGWLIVLRAILIAAAAIVAYGLATRVWPSLDENDLFARLGAPFSYWNALGATAALAVPPAIWLGARRSGHAPVNALAYPLLSLLVVAIFLSYSRAAIIVAGIGALVWVAFTPLRLRSIAVLGVSLAGAAPVIVWALQKDAFTKNAQPMAVRESVATQFGLFLLATVIVMLGAGLAIGFRVARRPPRAPARLRLGLALGVVACAVPIALFVVLSSSDRGLGGTLKASYESLTSTSHRTSGGPGRLLSASSSRGLYWRQSRQVFESHYWKGTGANTFGVGRLRFRDRDDHSVSQHAHGFVHQTGADLGIAGLAATLVLLLAWLIAAGRAVGAIRRRRRGPLPWTPERVGLVALALAAIVYGLHSAVDWIWFVPGPTVMALVAAGYVAGRGPFAAAAAAAPPAVALAGASPGRAGEGVRAAETPVPALAGAAAAPAAAGPGAASALLPPPPPPPPPPGPAEAGRVVDGGAANGNGHADGDEVARRIGALASGDSSEAPTQSLAPPPPPPPERRRRPRLPKPGRAAVRPALALLALAAALLCAFAIWQPLRSDRESDRALDLSAEGKFPQALAAADRAHHYDPLTPRPFVVRSSIQDAAGNSQGALAALEQAVHEFPGDPQVWLQLAQYELNAMGRPADALAIVRAALYLDPQSRAAQAVFLQASAALRPPVPAPAPAVPASPAPAAPAAPKAHSAPKGAPAQPPDGGKTAAPKAPSSGGAQAPSN